MDRSPLRKTNDSTFDGFLFSIRKCFSQLFLTSFILWGALFLATPLAAIETLLTNAIAQEKMKEVYTQHFLYHELTEELVQRQLECLLEDLDASYTYFTRPEIESWLCPTQETLTRLKKAWSKSDFSELDLIHALLIKGMQRRQEMEASINLDASKKTPVDREELRKEKWVENEALLKGRIEKLKLLQEEVLTTIDASRRPLIERKIKQQRQEYEAPYLSSHPQKAHHAMLQAYLHAFAESFDAHTCYFTPEEARQMISLIQRKITGIGVVLREEIDGYYIQRLVEGTPAALNGQIRVGDRIVAVDGEPTIGLDLSRGVLLIQGPKGSEVKITLQRSLPASSTGATTNTETFEVNLKRDDIVLQESRYRVQEEAFGKGKIGIISLYSFYQDLHDSCANDLRREIEKMKSDGKLDAIILDLRQNTGGVMPQGIEICGLFLHPGVIVSARLPDGSMSHMRLLRDDPVWEGPLIVLQSKGSASCSEIVAGTLQDYQRAIVVGDPSSRGKGSFQLFMLAGEIPDPNGVFTITQGIYYTVSGRSPQLTGVLSDIVVKGPLANLEIEESTLKYPLPNQTVAASFEDALDDVGYFEKQRLQRTYLPKLQQRLPSTYHWLEQLRANSQARLAQNKPETQAKKPDEADKETATESPIDEHLVDSQQLHECLNIAKDWLFLLKSSQEREAI